MAVAAVLGLTALTAYSQYQAGKQQAKAVSAQADYNAKIYERQASMIQNQKKLEEYQYNRQAARLRGQNVASAGGRGLLLTGSPLAVMTENETQIQLDKAIGQYNYDIQTNYYNSQAAMTRWGGNQQANLLRAQGRSNAFQTILGGIGTMASMNSPSKVPASGGAK